MTASSVHFKPVKSAANAVSHASREINPTYLLPPEFSLGTIVVLDDEGMVAETLNAKRALASRQALRTKDFSPLWEGVINLRRPEPTESVESYKKECKTAIQEWCAEYEKLTGHKVLRADVHLDEGHIENGKALLNAHAHVICDKTNHLGRVLKINAPTLRKIQDLTAKATKLERGKNSLETGVVHLGHQAYRHLAERGRLDTQQKVGRTKMENFQRHEQRIAKVTQKLNHTHASEIAQIKAQYDQDRATLKASGEATQGAYQALKIAHEAAIAALKKANEKVVELEKQAAKLEGELTKAKAVQPAPMPPEATRTAQEPPKQPEAPIPSTAPEKTIVEALAASWDAFVGWVKGKGGTVVRLDTQKSDHLGAIVQLDDLHCVQSTGRGQHVIHQLDKLDRVPGLDDKNMEIRYRNGVGQVVGKLGQVVER